MEFEFPFEVPGDLTSLDDAAFAALATQAREHGRQVLADPDSKLDALSAYQTLLTSVQTEEDRRKTAAQAAIDARAALSTLTEEPPAAPVATEPEPTPPAAVPDPATVPAPAATPPAVPPTGTLDSGPEPEKEKFAVLVASADAPRTAGELTDFKAVGRLLDTQFGRYGRPGNALTNRQALALGGNRFAVGGRSMVRHNIAAVQRQYPAEFRITDASNVTEVLDNVRNEARLPGGSLAQSALRQVEAGKSLTAAAGWCAPSEIIYDLCSLSSRDGMLDVPTIQASRGGFQIPENGGPNFATIYDLIGDEGDVILTEYEVENGADKVCVEVPCPPFVDVRLDVAYLCITGNMLQQRGYPEAVTHFTQEALTALAHKVNASMIARLVAGSTAPATIAEATGSTDAASQVQAAVEIAAMDMRYRHRMPLNSTVEVVMPAWVTGPIRAAMARRRGVAELNVSDAEIMSWFATRGVRVQFVYDWQDAFTGGTFGGSSSATAFPATVTFLMYPAGTWVKGEQDVIALDTIYDNAMLTNNQFTALFVEDGLSAMKMCADSRLYTTNVNPAGITACCP